jgi:hypothetical protein
VRCLDSSFLRPYRTLIGEEMGPSKPRDSWTDEADE